MSESEIAAFVELQRRRYAEARAGRDALGRRRFTAPIEPHLGTVTVDCWGELLEVRLRRDGLRVADPRGVAARVLTAVHTAEARAARAVEEYLRAEQ